MLHEYNKNRQKFLDHWEKEINKKIEMDKHKEVLKSQYEQEKEKEELDKCTFSPEITKKSKQMDAFRDSNQKRHDILFEYATVKEQKLNSLKKHYDSLQEQEIEVIIKL